MQSQSFIKSAATLIERIELSGVVYVSPDEAQERDTAIQKDINQLFAGLQNPTLPSATRLRETALEHGFTVDPRVQQRLDQAERFWQA